MKKIDKMLKFWLHPIVILTFLMVSFTSKAQDSLWSISIHVIDEINSVGQFNSFKIDYNDELHVSYYDADSLRLKYAHSNSGGSWEVHVIDTAMGVGKYSSITVDNFGRKSISYYNPQNGSLMYAGWLDGNLFINTDDIVDNGGDVGQYSSLAINNSGNLFVSYYKLSSDILMFAYKSGNAWISDILDQTEGVGKYTSLCIDPLGRKSISYYNANNGSLMYAGWLMGNIFNKTIDIIDNTGNVGQYNALSIHPTGKYHVSYFDATNNHLKYAFSDGSGWNKETVDPATGVGKYSSIAVDGSLNNNISYYDESSTALKYAGWIDNSFWNQEAHLSNGIALQVIETDGTNDLVKYVGFVNYEGGEQIEYSELINGYGFLGFSSKWEINYKYRPKIILLDGNPQNSSTKVVGHIYYYYNYESENDLPRQAIIFLHNDTEICANDYFPYTNSSPDYSKRWNYYKLNEYPVTMLVPPIKRMPKQFIKSPLLFVHGVCGSYNINHPDVILANNEVTYWYTTSNIINERGNFDGWEYYYPFDTDIPHLGICLKRAILELYTLYNQKINLVTHSMGGLVTLSYLTNNKSDASLKLKKVLFTVPPAHGSLGANKLYKTKLGGIIEPLGEMDNEAPAYKDMSLGSDFLWNIHAQEIESMPDLNNSGSLYDDYFVIIGSTKEYYKFKIYRNYLHEESAFHTDGVVSMSSASLLDHGVGFATIPGNHDDGRFGQSKDHKDYNIGSKNLIPDIIEAYFNDQPNSYESFINQIINNQNEKFDTEIGAVVNNDGNVLRPQNTNLSEINTPNHPTTGTNEIYQKNLINFTFENTPPIFNLSQSYYVFINSNNTIKIDYKLNRKGPGFNQIGYFERNPLSGNYFYFKDIELDPFTYTVLKNNSNIENISGDLDFIVYPDKDSPYSIHSKDINIGFCHTYYKTFNFGANKSIFANNQTDLKKSNIAPENTFIPESLKISFFVDDQTTFTNFILSSYSGDITYSLKIQMPDDAIIDSSYTVGTWSKDAFTGMQQMNISNPMFGEWKVWAESNVIGADTTKFEAKLYLQSDIFAFNLTNQIFIPLNDSIIISTGLNMPDPLLYDSLSVLATIIKPDLTELNFDLVPFSLTTDSGFIFNYPVKMDTVGDFTIKVNYLGKYGDFWFERLVYHQFEVYDVTPYIYIPDITLKQNNESEVFDLGEQLYCYDCEPDSMNYIYNIIDFTIDTNLVQIELNDTIKTLSFSTELADTGQITMKILSMSLGEIIAIDTFIVFVEVPDLLLENYTVSNSSTFADSLVNVELQIRNNGNIYANTHNFGIFLSPDNILDKTDQNLYLKEFIFLDPDTIISIAEPLHIPYCVQSGTYYLILKEDTDETIVEVSESNNLISLPLTITGNSLPFSINIGNDTIICQSYGHVLDAGPGHTSYQWSDGSINQTTTTHSSGIYWVAVDDGEGCYARDSINLEFGELYNIKALIEGPYNGTILNNNLNGLLPLQQPYFESPWNYMGAESVTAIPNSNIVDWVLVELRKTTANPNTATPDSIYARQAAFLLQDGTVTGLDGINPIRFCTADLSDTYIVIWHRNHIGIMSANEALKYGGNYYLNLIDNPYNILGNIKGVKQLSDNTWGMIAADGNADGQVENKDKNDIWVLQLGETGYKNGDYNLNGEVESTDKDNLWKSNSGKGGTIPK